MSKKPRDEIEDANSRSERVDQIKRKIRDKPGDDSLADDLLIGADEIAEFIYGDRTMRRKIYYLKKASRIPLFRLGTVLCARKSTLCAWITEQETSGSRDAFRSGVEPVVKRDPPARRDERDGAHDREQNPEGIGPGQPS